MSVETDSSEISSQVESLLRSEGGFSLFLSFMLGLTQETDPDQELPDPTRDRDRTILIDPSTQTLLFVRSQSSLEAFLNGVVPGKQGRPPASKSAVEGMPRVEIKEKEVGSCVICLEEWSEGDVTAEMPCKHRFHSKCVEEWLGIHGTCPVCRYEMPVEEEEEDKKVEILFRIAINGDGRRRIRTQTEGQGEAEVDSEPRNETEV